jgi:hypothetical protein
MVEKYKGSVIPLVTVGPAPLNNAKSLHSLSGRSEMDMAVLKDDAILSVMVDRPKTIAISSSTTMSDPELCCVTVC